MKIPSRNLEELFLKISRVVLLIVMGLSIVAAILLPVAALWDYSKTPKEPAPAQKAPEKEISIEGLIKNLEQSALAKDDAKSSGSRKERQPEQTTPTLQYLEQVTKLYRCSADFGKKVGAEIEASSAEDAQRVEQLRARIEEIANRPGNGEQWVTSAVTFTCAALGNPSLIKLRADGKVDRVFIPALNFHLKTWREIREEKQVFEQRESTRVAGERAAEELRILAAKARAYFLISAAGASFAAFMLLAFFLLAWKIETDLREINGAIRLAAPQKKE